MSRFLSPLPLVCIKTNYFLAPVIELPRKKGKDVSGVISGLRLFLCALSVFFFFLSDPFPFPIQWGWQELSCRHPPYEAR